MSKVTQQYANYMQTIGNRMNLYRTVTTRFNIRTALYPGSHIDITPSFVIPHVTYVDSFKGTIAFFKDMDDIFTLVKQKKEYSDTPVIQFYGENYEHLLPIEKVDLIISQYAGFVGQHTKRYLKQGGLLLCNDSHGDATLAFLDEQYEFVGVIQGSSITTSNLDAFFTFKRPREIDKVKVLSTMKGPNYKNKAENYLFRLTATLEV